MSIEYHPIPGTNIFAEGDPGDKFYVLIEGRVGIYKTFSEKPEGKEQPGEAPRPVTEAVNLEQQQQQQQPEYLIGEFGIETQYPWFGEMALADHRNVRSARATVLEPAKLLSLDRANFAAFLQVVPNFAQMFSTSLSSYTALNQITRIIRKGEEGRKARKAAREAAEEAELGALLPQTDAPSQMRQRTPGGSFHVSSALDQVDDIIGPGGGRDSPTAERPSFSSSSKRLSAIPAQLPPPEVQNEFERAHRESLARRPNDLPPDKRASLGSVGKRVSVFGSSGRLSPQMGLISEE